MEPNMNIAILNGAMNESWKIGQTASQKNGSPWHGFYLHTERCKANPMKRDLRVQITKQ